MCRLTLNLRSFLEFPSQGNIMDTVLVHHGLPEEDRCEVRLSHQVSKHSVDMYAVVTLYQVFFQKQS